MVSIWIAILLSAIAFVVTMLVYPHVLGFARRHNIVDNPNARKLQRVPVPVMGGMTVYIGLLVSSLVAFILIKDIRIIKMMVLVTIMGAVGVWDDVKDVSASLRFGIEFFVV